MAILMAGMIGIGKSTVANLIGNHLNSQVFFESVDDNPILPMFYPDQKRWAFALQIYFMNTRIEAYEQSLYDENNVLDRSIYEDVLFAKVNALQGNMSEIELNTYLMTLDNVMKRFDSFDRKRKDLLVYLDGSFETVMSRIRARGRSYELDQDLIKYYKLLHSNYPNWLAEYDKSPVLVIDMDKYDVNREEDAKAVLTLVDNKLKELEMA